MAIVIEKKTEMPLLDKTLIEASAYSVMPSKNAVRKDLASQLSIPEELVDIEHIYPLFGTTKTRIMASAYKEQKAKEFFKKKVKKTTAASAGGGA